MRVLPIDPAELGPIVLRQVPEERPPTADGERVFLGRVIVPSERGPVECRLRTPVAYDGSPGVVTLSGTVRATSWYVPSRSRDADAKSEITISAEQIHPAPGATPVLSGRDLPVRLGFDETLILSVVDMIGGSTDKRVSLMLPSELFDGEGGVVEVSAAAVDADVVPGVMGRLVGVSGRISIPDKQDIGRFTKAQIRLSCRRVEAVSPAASNGRSRRDPVTVPAGGEDTAPSADS